MTSLPSFRLFAALVPVVLFLGCGPQGDMADDGTDDLAESGSALSLAPGSVAQILALVNDPATDLVTLDEKVALDARAAKAILLHRNGADAVSPSSDDAPFATLAELDAISYVGDAALKKLLAYAVLHPAPAAETVEGISFRGWESKAVVWGVNNATEATLDAMLDARAAKSLIAGRPFTSVAAMGPLAYVGPAALDRLRREASNWWKQSTNAPKATVAEVQTALETATNDLLMPSETDARFVFLKGEQLNGAPVTVTVVRAQLTAQHDALIATVMYTDPSERSLAAKTQVENPSAADFFNNLINNVDPNDPASIAQGQKFQTLYNVLQQNLTDLKVYRFGKIAISTMIVGRAPTGELVGLLTGQVET